MVSSATDQPKIKRQRGVILTAAGLKRLQSAIQESKFAEGDYSRYTLEKLSEYTNVSTKTLSRLWSLESGVDRKTLRLCFSAFNLELRESDYVPLSQQDREATEISASIYNQAQASTELPQAYTLPQSTQPCIQALTNQKLVEDMSSLSYPDGPVGLGSPFYIERPPFEVLACQEISQPGCMVRIQAPKRLGKSSLMLRVATFAEVKGYQTATIDCNQFDLSCLTDLNRFLRCFCLSVARVLEIEHRLEQHWDEDMGSKLSCSFYFKSYLLNQIDAPVVLVLNEVNRLFKNPQLTREFFLLLRSWHEEARQSMIWQKLRLVIVYSTEEFVPPEIRSSLFNIGLLLHLPEFTPSQVHDLAQRYGLDWNAGQIAELIALIGGHPFLNRIAFYHICREGLSLEQLLQQASERGGMFREHLWELWVNLQKHPELIQALETLVASNHGVSLNPDLAYRLEMQGLIGYENDRVNFRCQLYRDYFRQQLSSA